MRRPLNTVLIVLSLTCLDKAVADWVVTQHNGQIPSQYWTYDADLQQIIVRDSIPAQPFRFSVSDTQDPQGLGTVNAIVAQTSMRLAVVTIEIRNPNQPSAYGARDVKAISLSGSGNNGFDDVWLGTVRVAGHLGQSGIDPLHGVDANSSIIVGGNLLSSLRSDLNHAARADTMGSARVHGGLR